jgi:hypothetical protein
LDDEYDDTPLTPPPPTDDGDITLSERLRQTSDLAHELAQAITYVDEVVGDGYDQDLVDAEIFSQVEDIIAGLRPTVASILGD